MIISPRCSIRSLDECRAGSLVRLLGHYTKASLAIVGDIAGSESRGLVLLDEDEPPLSEIIGQPESFSVLSYEDDCILEIDHDGPFESFPRDLYEAPGCIVVEKNRWLINVRRGSESMRQTREQYDVLSGNLGPTSNELNDIAIFGKWDIYLCPGTMLRSERIKMASFTRKPRKAE